MRTAAVRRELGFPKSDELPGQWTWELVNLRLVEAFEAEPSLPGEYSTGTSRVRPDHLYDEADLEAQAEADEETKAARVKAASRVKLLPHQMSLVLVTLKWPADYLAAADEKLSLAADPAHSRIVQRVARGLARGRAFAIIAGELRKSEPWLRRRYREGCERIAAGLRRDRVPVF
jgi:hypothetical protein